MRWQGNDKAENFLPNLEELKKFMDYHKKVRENQQVREDKVRAELLQAIQRDRMVDAQI